MHDVIYYELNVEYGLLRNILFVWSARKQARKCKYEYIVSYTNTLLLFLLLKVYEDIVCD